MPRRPAGRTTEITANSPTSLVTQVIATTDAAPVTRQTAGRSPVNVLPDTPAP
ncbi:hypothetical protein GCM10022380_31630 [Amycolatopsis tucumanensis]|uniref:Uncharacterized protein n=1 Tax=Amycolatopsis tucumanensis TaxID=401106 RepID=A0ABP7I7I5_9PSEU